MNYIDTHAHITSNEIFPHVDEVLARAQQTGVSSIVNICTDAETLFRGLQLAKRYPWIFNAAATHPHDVDLEGNLLFETMAQHAKSGFLIAVGETGLDYHYTHSSRHNQKTLLKRYLTLAVECHLPVIIHCRDAFEDFFSILDETTHGPGVVHCFTGTKAEAQEVIRRGWFISFSGIVTFKKSEALREIVKEVPLDRLLIETDAPFLAPQSQRGKVNEPSFLPEMAMTLAQVKNLPLEEICRIIRDNTRRLFGEKIK